MKLYESPSFALDLSFGDIIDDEFSLTMIDHLKDEYIELTLFFNKEEMVEIIKKMEQFVESV